MTLAVTAVRSYVVGSPQILITVTSTTSAPNAVPNFSAIGLVRIHADGSRWQVLTDADPQVIGGGWAWLDTHAPYNQAIRYEVRTAGLTVTSTATFSPSTKAWLLSPTMASLGFEIDGIKEITERTSATRSGRFEPIGAEAIYLSDGRRNGIAGSMTLRVPVARQPALARLFASDSMVLINTPGTLGWDISWLWVQPTAISFANPSNLVKHPYRNAQMAFEQGAQPFADLVPTWTSGAAAAYFLNLGTTSAGVPALYADSLRFSTNTRL